MVPYLSRAFEQMGVLDQFQGKFMPKLGGEIARTDGWSRRIDFKLLHPGQHPFAFNLDRTRADHVLLRHAERAGATVLQEAAVTRLLLEGERVAGVAYLHRGEQHSARATWVIDASGRAGVVATRLRLRRMNQRLRKVGIYQFYDHLIPENNPSAPEDAVFSTDEDGWVWCFPVSPDRVSVGAVVPAEAVKGRDPAEVFAAYVARAPRVSARIRGATPVDARPRVESDYCYHAETLSGPGFFLVGDAACFVDPMMSGGFYLAVMTGMKAGEAIAAILAGADEALTHRAFENFCKTGYDSYFRLIYAFYEECRGDLFQLLGVLAGGLPFSLQTAVGDYWGRADQPYLAYLRSRADWSTFDEPFEIVYTCPLYPDAHYTAADGPAFAAAIGALA